MMLARFLNVVFPPQCGGCESTGTGLCAACLPQASLVSRKLPTLNVTALGDYDGRLRKAVLALKNGRRDVASAFARRLSAAIVPETTLVPVPTTRARRRERGFDGCELLTHLIAQRVPVRVEAGLEQVSGDAQRGRHREARLAAHGRFVWRGQALDGAMITLLDDVVTTGATLEDCASVVRAAGGIVERALVIAQAHLLAGPL